MTDYQATSQVSASADAVFSYQRDVRHLPKYFARMTSAEPGDGDTVQVTADVHGQQEAGEAWFHVDNAGKVISWGSEGPNNDYGELRVDDTDHGGDTASVTVTLSTDRVATDEIQQGLEDTLANIQRIVEES